MSIDEHSVMPDVESTSLISNRPPFTMRDELLAEFNSAEEVDISVAFITDNAFKAFVEPLRGIQGKVRIVTSDYLGFNSPAAFRELLWHPNVDAYIYNANDRGFHPKGYVFRSGEKTVSIIGSSNLTESALVDNEEWNVRVSTHSNGPLNDQVLSAIEDQINNSVPLTLEWIQEYEKTWTPKVNRLLTGSDESVRNSFGGNIEPNDMQKRALASLAEAVINGARRALIVSATGTGKTILAALSVRQQEPRRVLFVVHREQILDKAIEEFQKVLQEPASHFGKLTGASKDVDAKYIFATIQTLSKPENLVRFDPGQFDQIIIDEVHRAGAGSYLSIVDYFKPKLLLGLTATPERTDGFNVYEVFDYNTVFEIRLGDALDQGMVVPFHYFGVQDYTDLDGNSISDTEDLSKLVVDQRIDHLLENLQIYGYKTEAKGLIFCSRNDEARELSAKLNDRSVLGRRLRTLALSGSSSMEDREKAVERLERGELDYIVTVDIFNEGVDIPTVNQVVMLRPTQSAIVFTQQLGRGLRKAHGKSHLVVIDFIGNYKNSFLIPVALFNDTSANRDSLRRRILDGNIGPIKSARDGQYPSVKSAASISSVNFDRVARQRVLAAINSASLDSIHALKKSVQDLRNRIGRIPMLIDFAKSDTLDGVVLANKANDYWTLLSKMKVVDDAPTPEMAKILRFLSSELLNGKRPDELRLLKEILAADQRSNSWVEYQASAYSNRVQSVQSVLSLKFYKESERIAFGSEPIVEFYDGGYRLSQNLRDHYQQDLSFRMYVDDIIDTGLFYSSQRYRNSSTLLPGKTYSRKDATRLLDWEVSNYQTVYGYKNDLATMTCPIFVTYHKDEEISDSTRYGDSFIDRKYFRWFSRSRRRLTSKEIMPIVSNDVKLHVFVKRDDTEGIDFFYLGEARCESAIDTTIEDSKNGPLDIVEMTLEFDEEVPMEIYDHITASID